MPETSEILQPADSDDSDLTLRSSESVGESNHDDNLSFLSVISLVIARDIPLVNLPRMQGVEGMSYGLGSGVTSTVIRHVSGDESNSICPVGTMVALKKYNVAPKEPSEIKRLHRLLWQELQIFCHPFLKSHENICQMLYVGWEETKLSPVVALEMGNYGTLSSSLQQLRSYGSALRKSHLTADIIVGLAALHGCGYYHGDIKTDNIIIQQYEPRTLVAKLADFSGAKSVNTRREESRPDFGTPLWQPPEVLFDDQENDWQLADMYSLGMVIATLWSTEGYIPEGGMFLDPEMPYDLDTRFKKLWVGTIKAKDDSSQENLMNIAKKVTSCSELTAISVQSILAHTLSIRPSQRLSAKELLNQDAMVFLQQTGRQVSLPEGDTSRPEVYENDTTHEINLVENERYRERGSRFCQLSLSVMIETARDMLNKAELPELPDLEDGCVCSPEDIGTILEDLQREHQRLLLKSNIPASFQHLAFQIFLCYSCGWDTKVDESEAAMWLYRAAMAQNEGAMFWYCSVQDSFINPPHLDIPPPRRLWAASAAIEGIEKSGTWLKKTSPRLFSHVTAAYRQLHWGRKKKQPPRFQLSWAEIKEWVMSDGVDPDTCLPVRPLEHDFNETALHYATAVGDREFVIYLITQAGANINALNCFKESALFYAITTGQLEMAKLLLTHGADVTQISKNGTTPLHSLIRMDDNDAVALLPELLSRGADPCIKDPTDEEDGSDGDSTLPIMAAAIRQRKGLFDGLLEAHKSEKLDLVAAESLLKGLAGLHLSHMFQDVLSSLNDILKPSVSAHDEETELHTQVASLTVGSSHASTESQLGGDSVSLGRANILSFLGTAMGVRGGWSMLRRNLHGSHGLSEKRSTIATLLNFGAKLAASDLENSMFVREALKQAINVGDTIALPLCIEAAELEGIDLNKFLADPAEFSGSNALCISMVHDVFENFSFLLERYPPLRGATCGEEKSNLHVAARLESTIYTRILLEHGADRYSRNASGENPFLRALVFGPNIEAASLIIEGADKNRILGPCPVTGLTAFNRLLCLLGTFKHNIDIRAFRYLVDNFGPPSIWFQPDENLTVFRYLLSTVTPFTDTEQLNQESILFQYLTQQFDVGMLDWIDPYGKAPMHYAASFADTDAIKTLLARGAKFDILTTTSGVPGEHAIQGLTPLALAIMLRQRGPPSRLKEGSVDVRIWQKRINEIIDILCQHGHYCGPGADMATRMRAWVAADPGLASVIVVTNTEAPPDIIDKSGYAEWPKKIPREVELPNTDESVEVIRSNGLSEFVRTKTFKFIQEMASATNDGVRTGNMAARPGKAPQDYLDQLEQDWKKAEWNWAQAVRF